MVAEALALLDDQTRLEQAKLERLRAEIEKGLASSEPKPLDMDSVIKEAKKRYDERNS